MDSRNYAFKAFGDGDHIYASVHWPKQRKNQPYGIALAFHGGGFVVGSRNMLPMEQIEYLANSGLVVVSADYRLCPQVSLYEGPIQDAKDAYTWCKRDLPALLKNDESVDVDPSRIVVFGHSAGGCLALHTGALPDPPRAILDFYGVKCTTDRFWFAPLPALAMIPSLEDAFLNQIHSEPVLSNTMLSLERAANTNTQPKTKGLPRPDLSIPRNAWLFVKLKEGTHLPGIVQDGDYERIDPVRSFSANFPPTFFVHGNADAMVLPEFSVKAHEKLQSLGVETRILLPEGKSHGFDVGVEPEDEDFASIRAGLDFLVQHV
ncbi:Alpha/beta hydrolase fold-3 [Penicillium paradoxum]|uniref:Alpha/beta hydrolase fold-3 n=1 Tax=Penicillium paradoxum TaxID=176176 RepID=UPI002547B512|nr:Alpha/beta hydrolase fold-3 [Penicillium paradoxum]KAJ5774422.1 Alpha/beta hydrolase fold-3 [Penicillium paradoxum]